MARNSDLLRSQYTAGGRMFQPAAAAAIVFQQLYHGLTTVGVRDSHVEDDEWVLLTPSRLSQAEFSAHCIADCPESP